jgi:hypothetical protein
MNGGESQSWGLDDSDEPKSGRAIVEKTRRVAIRHRGEKLREFLPVSLVAKEVKGFRQLG